MGGERLPSDAWLQLGIVWYGYIDDVPDSVGVHGMTAGCPSILSTPYAVVSWLTRHLEHCPEDAEVLANIGEGWTSVGTRASADITRSWMLAAAAGNSVELRVTGYSGTVHLRAEAAETADPGYQTPGLPAGASSDAAITETRP